MKKILLIVGLVILISSFTFQWSGGDHKAENVNVIDVRTVMVKGHEYVVASQSQGYKQGGGVAIVHSESCPICYSFKNKLNQSKK